MKIILLLPLLLALPKPIFASDSTENYKLMDKCNSGQVSLWKKEDDNSKKWGTYVCEVESGDCIWAIKGVSYDEANSDYEYLCSGM